MNNVQAAIEEQQREEQAVAALAISSDVSVIGPQEGTTTACCPPQLPSSAAEECHDCYLPLQPAAELEGDNKALDIDGRICVLSAVGAE